MSVRSILVSRKFIIPALALAVSVGVASVAYSFSWGTWFARSPVVVESADAKAKAKHVPIVTLRDRMLGSFHGKTTDLFTSIPGFGMERMTPLYKSVPFQTPDLSTSEVEVENQVVPPEVLQDVFAKSLNGFRDPSKPIPPSKNKTGTDPFGDRFGKVVVRGLQLRLLDLVGLINADGPKVYAGGKAFELQRMTFEEGKAARAKNPNAVTEIELRGTQFGNAVPAAKKPAEDVKLETRPLDVFEIAGVAELNQGKDLYVRHKDNVIRMLGALRATEQCLECHGDHKKGDLLGAFSYTFVDTDKSLVKALGGGSTK